MNGLLVRVGADQGKGGGWWNAPANSTTREFAYVPIPEVFKIRRGFAKPFRLVTEHVERLGTELPSWLARKNMHLVEMAQKGDWVVGTGGVSPDHSVGHGKIIYAMRVTEKLTLPEYYRRYPNRRDSSPADIRKNDRFALLSKDFFYFGRNAVPIPDGFLKRKLEKRGPRYRCDFDETFISDFENWLSKTYRRGVHGPPCKRTQGSKCTPHLRRKPSA